MRSFASLAVCLMLGMLSLASVRAAAAEIAFTDQRGQLVTLSGPAKRTVAFPKPVPSLYIAVDDGIEHLVGIHPAAQSAIMGSVLGKFFPGVADISTGIVAQGFVPNVEELLKINPDVVIQWALKTDQYIEPMERVGLTVVGLSYGSYEIERERISIIGKIAQQEQRANSFLAWHDQVRQNLHETLSSIPQEKRVRMVFVDRLDNNELALFGRDEFFFQMAGLRNLAFEAGLNQGTVTVSAEQVLAWDPEIVFLNYYDAAITPADFYDNPVYDSMTAVKDRRIYKMPTLGTDSHEAPLVWMWMTMLAYPELEDWDLRRTVANKYVEMYGQRPSDADVDQIMQLATNGESRNYLKKFGR